MINKYLRKFVLLAAAGAALLSVRGATAAIDRESPELAWWRQSMETRDQRLGWYREARFGMFIHWGVYSGLGGTWNGQAVSGYSEHIQRRLKIPIPVYREQVAGKFNPTEFNADEWIRTAKEAGMGYIAITAKHHDGFAMWDSKVSDYNIVQASPFHRDPMKELKAACDKYGVKLGFYYSQAFDWGDAEAPGNDWDYKNPGGDRGLYGGKTWWDGHPELVEQCRRYVDRKAIPQLMELIHNYHPALFWFDVGGKMPPEENLRIMKAVRAADPNVIINGRLVYGMGDYVNTTDNPWEFPPHAGDWEGIPTTNGSYGYNQNAKDYLPPEHFIRLLAKAVARGGNILMNIGPMGTGKFSAQDAQILHAIAAWMKVNADSIHGCVATPLPVQAWGQSTRKGDTLYLHVFDWPTDGRLVVGGLKSDVSQAYLLSDAGKSPLPVERVNANDVAIHVPAQAPDAIDSVIAVRVAGGDIATDPARLLATNVPANTLHVFDGKLQGTGIKYGIGKKTNDYIEAWPSADDSVTWPSRLNEPATFDVTLNYEADAASTGGTYAVKMGSQTLHGTVKDGKIKDEPLGKVTLEPGAFDVVVQPEQFKGNMLMHLRNVVLTPVK